MKFVFPGWSDRNTLKKIKSDLDEAVKTIAEKNEEIMQLRRDINQLAMMIVTIADAAEYNHNEIQEIKSILLSESPFEVSGSTTTNAIDTNKLN